MKKQKQEYIWKNGIFIKRQNAKISVLTHSLHYGSAVFEGIRAYNTKQGTAILKLQEHISRFQYSMQALKMQCNYNSKTLCHAVINTVKKNKIKTCYIRPLAYFAEQNIKVLPKENHKIDIIIACIPMTKYLQTNKINMMISKYIRIHPKSTICDAKIAGHYVNSILASMETRNTHYHEALLLDTNGNITEGSMQNVFIIKNNILITTPTGKILNGITRQLIIKIAQNNNIQVSESYFTPKDMINAEEAFCSGTAIEIAIIINVNNHIIGKGKTGKITQLILKKFKNITNGDTLSSDMTYI